MFCFFSAAQRLCAVASWTRGSTTMEIDVFLCDLFDRKFAGTCKYEVAAPEFFCNKKLDFPGASR